MKEFLASWIVIQLVVMGLVAGLFTYDCSRGIVKENSPSGKFSYIVTGVVFPLSVFVPNDNFKCNQ